MTFLDMFSLIYFICFTKFSLCSSQFCQNIHHFANSVAVIYILHKLWWF